MSVILKIEKLLTIAKRELLRDKDIRKLLYYSTPDALEREAPSIEEVERYIHISNYVDREKEESQSAFIVIFSEGFSSTDGASDVSFQIGAFSWKEHYLLNDNRVRTLRLIHRIRTVLEDKKIDFSEKLRFEGAVIEGHDKGQVLGYYTLWGVSDSDVYSGEL